jgi:hypothetical protein
MLNNVENLILKNVLIFWLANLLKLVMDKIGLRFAAFILILLSGNKLPAQDVTEKDMYELLLQQISLYQSVDTISTADSLLLVQARDLAAESNFQLANIYLEEITAGIKYASNVNKGDEIEITENTTYSVIPAKMSNQAGSQIGVSIVSGIDYNRQEFGVDYIETDSIILDQISRPYVGFTASFIYQLNPQHRIQFFNVLRYDNEYLRNDYSFTWLAGDAFSVQYNGYWNQAKSILSASFWEHEFNSRLLLRMSPTLVWRIDNNLRYKNFNFNDANTTDYIRNRFNIVLEYSQLSLEYNNEFNESLNSEDYDYIQHFFRFGFFNPPGAAVTYDMDVDFSVRDYTIVLGDSLIENNYSQAGARLYLDHSLTGWLKWMMEEQFIYKVYQEKSYVESDYIWNLLRPGFVFNMYNRFDITLAYEWEVRRHMRIPNDVYDASEQDFGSNGVYLSLTYFSAYGSYFSSSLSYLLRRYPKSAANDVLSVYSDQKILSLTLMAYWPISKHLYLNAYIMYDNDDAIDLDQVSNQSTILTVEFEYRF